MSIEIRDFPVPDVLRARALAWMAAEDAGTTPEPAPARPASTVMLVRDGEAGQCPEVFMIRRVSTMEFAPNMWVFPGGGVDDRDADPDLPWAGPTPRQWAAALVARDESQARELVIAAAREVFEECGVLLAGPDEHTVVADVSGSEWEAERQALLSRDQSFAQLLIRRGLMLRTDLMRARAHWITPVFEPRRFDTRFFAALLPQGQVPDDATTEADTAAWVRPDDLLAELEAGTAMMFPPTKVCLEQVTTCTSAASFLVSGPAVRVIMPALTRLADRDAVDSDNGGAAGDNGDGIVMRTELPV
ncbi:MAG: NUDIX domain-containing protein [Austwickia sp.]|jgi:8-oxo-dGTP pyrophosphatase MutT (NUDIX family)|nr:NUDIX domain-containing protein [Austwickia sp.]MBK8437777.1 NUDIX domain-containing protein [Austwickia sp.]MBK9100085.1 NUDIX domain-containing protein [Austwickia sp.]